MSSMWRTKARELVAEVLQQTKGDDDGAVRRALREAYPFGNRRYWPYKVWLDEIHRQRQIGKHAPRQPEVDDRQGTLF